MTGDVRTARWALVLLSLCAVVVGWSARAQAASAAGQERLVYSFNFEEREKGNYEELPMHWYPIGRIKREDDPNFNRMPLHQELMRRSGFPVYTEVRFDERYHTSGKESFYLGLNGGSAGAFLEVGTIPIVPNSDFLVSANVRTTVLQYARARLVAYFVDADGRRIEDSWAATDLIRTDNRWETVSVKLRGDFPKAAWIGMELLLLQPHEQPDSLLGKNQVVYQEVHGGVWFDDIDVWQLPRVTVGTQSPVNIIRMPERPRLNMEVRDLSGRALLADVIVFDHTMKRVAFQRQPVGNGAPVNWRWSPQLPALGWYLVELDVREPDAPVNARNVSRSFSAFLWLEDVANLYPADSQRFALESEDVDDDEFDLLPTLFDAARVDTAVVSCWSRQMTLSNLEDRQTRLDKFLQTMLVQGREVTLSLTPVPRELARSLDIDADSPLSLLQKPDSSWVQWLAPILLRDGQRVRRWQLGSTRQPDVFFVPELATLLSAAEKTFQSLAPQPDLLVPWDLEQSRRKDVPATIGFAIDAPASIHPDAFRAYLQEWANVPSKAELRLNLRELPATEVGHVSRVNNLAKRMIYAWEACPGIISLDHPWTISRERDTEILPDPLLGVFSSVAQRLAGRRVVGTMPLGDGMECMVFDGPAGGMLAAWNRSADPHDAVINMYLGPSPVAIDVFGNKSVVPMIDGRHSLAIGASPTFITGIDPALALFRASFHLTDPFIESTQTSHERGIIITNPWPRTISGYMLIVNPRDWQIEPRRNFFSIAAGQSSTIPITLSFPVSEVAGRKMLIARFDFNADQHYVVEAGTTMEVGLRNVDFDADLTLERNAEGGRDAVVTMQITDSGEIPLSLYAFANLQGQPRQERIVPRLKPGQAVVRRFRFPNIGPQATTIRVGLREVSGPAVLNKVIAVQER